MTTTPLTFRQATETDVDELVTLVESAYRGRSGRAGWTTEADLISGQRVDADMLRAALRRPGTSVLVASDGERALACCELQRPQEGAAQLGMFAVAPDLQAGGIGRAVLAEAERIVGEEWGLGRLELSVIDAREELLAWYGRRGYDRTGELREFPYGDERFGTPRRDDLRFVVMAKDVRVAPGGDGGEPARSVPA